MSLSPCGPPPACSARVHGTRRWGSRGRSTAGWRTSPTRPARHPTPSGTLTDCFDNDPDATGEYGSSGGIQIQSLLRHTVSKTIAEGIVNGVIVTDSPEATGIHEHIFSRACPPSRALHLPWISPARVLTAPYRRSYRRCRLAPQTFTAAVESYSTDMSCFFLSEHMPNLPDILGLDLGDLKAQGMEKPAPSAVAAGVFAVLEAAYEFSRMLHDAPSSSGGTVDAFYHAFVPYVTSTVNPRQIKLVKRCHRTEHGEPNRVGATVFPGLVKVSRAPPNTGGDVADAVQAVVRRAQMICECAMLSTGPHAGAVMLSQATSTFRCAGCAARA
ncbi:uncharacterized protein BXZ73DRAFT_77987 [Epithele typhae]|uniref:uncharacterized protein n=1 Tax=Epithele typhae TaxID=378194 RepID=UPI0020082CE7|nr:uncharacterized protein BXZ73DRAFT_77987 [Epithele typhae]KAH9929867.1 hypothetical protein BXZ73DRAFT_77987 [Epithele typhae]